MKKADLNEIPARRGSAPYPDPYNEKLKGRTSWTLTSHFGLKQFGVNRVELAPGAWSTQRHWHRNNDEAVIVVSGELTLVTDEGEETLALTDPTRHVPDKELLEAELQEAIETAIRALPEKQRMAVVLRRYEGKSYEEIGEVLGLTVAAVKSLLFRARTELRSALNRYLEK